MVQKKKELTRAQAEKRLGNLADQYRIDPTNLVIEAEIREEMVHPNYHVRVKAWKLLDKPLSGETDQDNKFLAELFGKDLSKMSGSEQEVCFASLRLRAKV